MEDQKEHSISSRNGDNNGDGNDNNDNNGNNDNGNNSNNNPTHRKSIHMPSSSSRPSIMTPSITPTTVRVQQRKQRNGGNDSSTDSNSSTHSKSNNRIRRSTADMNDTCGKSRNMKMIRVYPPNYGTNNFNVDTHCDDDDDEDDDDDDDDDAAATNSHSIKNSYSTSNIHENRLSKLDESNSNVHNHQSGDEKEKSTSMMNANHSNGTDFFTASSKLDTNTATIATTMQSTNSLSNGESSSSIINNVNTEKAQSQTRQIIITKPSHNHDKKEDQNEINIYPDKNKNTNMNNTWKHQKPNHISTIHNHIKQIPEQTKSWHLETLFGLFLNCDDSEMVDIANRSKLKYDEMLSKVESNCLMDMKQPHRRLKRNRKRPRLMHRGYNNSLFLQQQQQKHHPNNQTFIISQEEKAVEEEEEELSVFPIFSEVLQRFKYTNYPIISHNNNNHSDHNNDNSIGNQTAKNNHMNNDSHNNSNKITKYRRKTYSSRSINQVENAVMDKFKEKIISKDHISYSIYGQDFQSPTSHFNSDMVTKKHQQIKTENCNVVHDNNEETYKTVSLLYNECSIRAISKWAIPFNSFFNTVVGTTTNTAANNTSPYSPLGIPESLSKHHLIQFKYPSMGMFTKMAEEERRYKAAQQKKKNNNNTKRNMNLKRVSYVPVASTTFRKCLACKQYGHYEVECETLSQKQILPQSQCAEISKWLHDEVKTQNVLRNFAAPSVNLDNSGSSKNKSDNKNNVDESSNSDNSSDDSDDEPLRRLDVRQDVELLKKRKSDLISYDYDCVGGSDIENKHPKTDFLTSLMNLDSSSSNNMPKNRIEARKSLPTIFTKKKEGHLQKGGGPLYEVCEVCYSKYQADELLVCDGCDRLYHKECLDPPLEHVPEGFWFCPNCYEYDSDVSSVVEMEAIDDFVIEQRKLTREEKVMSKNSGYYFEVDDANKWNTNVMVIPPQSNLLKDLKELPIHHEVEDDESRRQLLREMDEDSNYGKNDEFEFSAGELCFAKRSAPMASMKTVYARDMFWPAMVVKVQDSNIGFDGSIQTKYIVKLFALTGSGRVRASHVLPFFPNYEKLGQNKLKYRREEWYSHFRKGMMEALSQLGIASPAQGISHAREIASNQTSVPKTVETSLKSTTKNPNYKELPVNAELTQMDDFAIVSFGDERDTSQNTNSVDEDTAEKREEVQVFNTEELKGGVVSFVLEDQKELNFGVLSGVDKVRRRVMVHVVTDLSRVIRSYRKENLDNEFKNGSEENLCDVYTCKVGASLWVPIEAIVHYTTGSKFEENQYSSYLIDEATSEIHKEIKTQNELESKIKEDRMMKMDSMSHMGFGRALHNFGLLPHSETRSRSTSQLSTSIDDFDSSSYMSTESDNIVESSSHKSSSANDTVTEPEEISPVKSNESHDTSVDDSTMRSISSPSKRDKIRMSPSNCANGSTIFIVDKILDHRINKHGAKEYLIKWKGFGDDENTWEIQKNILDTNILRKYLAQNLIDKLQATSEANVQGSDTCRVIEIMKEGIHLLNTMLTITPPKPRKNRCPFCFQDFNMSGIGPHLKLHSEQPNFDLLKQVTKIADIDWYKAWEGSSKGHFAV